MHEKEEAMAYSIQQLLLSGLQDTVFSEIIKDMYNNAIKDMIMPFRFL